jgi:hypothetical protein
MYVRAGAFRQDRPSSRPVLHTVITEGSVSRAALGCQQPAGGQRQLKRLRALIGDPLLVRSGTGMAPTAVALALLEPAAKVLREARSCCSARPAATGRSTAATRTDLPHRRQRLPRPAVPARAGGPGAGSRRPACTWTCTPLSSEFDYRASWPAARWIWSSATGCRHRASCTWAACSATSWSAWWRRPPGGAQPARLDGGALPGGEHVAPTPLHAGGGRDRRTPGRPRACSAASRCAARTSAWRL